ncbi:MAG: hypothetical protein RMM08_11410 [Armatimonadota bacterium]|nr:hypothetical protein [Armatimonadota bacterium]
MKQDTRCPKCMAEVSDPKQPCSQCGFIMEHPQRKRYQRQVVVSGIMTLSGYVVGMFGLLLRWEVVGIAGLVMGFVGGVWFMISLYLLLRTGI